MGLWENIKIVSQCQKKKRIEQLFKSYNFFIRFFVVKCHPGHFKQVFPWHILF